MKHILIIAVCLLSFVSCTKKSTSTGSGSGGGTSGTGTTPVSTFNITFKGKTYSIKSSDLYSAVFASTLTNPGLQYGDLNNYIYSGYQVSIIASNSLMTANFQGLKLDPSTAIGTYRLGLLSTNYGDKDIVYGWYSFKDIDDGNKIYQTDGTGKDTTSTVTVTVANSTQCKGTFNIILSYNGSYYPATGDFDYRK